MARVFTLLSLPWRKLHRARHPAKRKFRRFAPGKDALIAFRSASSVQDAWAHAKSQELTGVRRFYMALCVPLLYSFMPAYAIAVIGLLCYPDLEVIGGISARDVFVDADSSSISLFGWCIIASNVLLYLLLFLLLRTSVRAHKVMDELIEAHKARIRTGASAVGSLMKCMKELNTSGEHAMFRFVSNWWKANPNLAKNMRGRKLLGSITHRIERDDPTTVLGVIDGNMRIGSFIEETRRAKPPSRFWYMLLYFTKFDCYGDNTHNNQVTRIFTYQQLPGHERFPLHQLCFHILNVISGVVTLIEVDHCDTCGAVGDRSRKDHLQSTIPISKPGVGASWQDWIEFLSADVCQTEAESWANFGCDHNGTLYGLDYVVIPRGRVAQSGKVELNDEPQGQANEAKAVVYVDFGKEMRGRKVETVGQEETINDPDVACGFELYDPLLVEVFKADFEHRLRILGKSPLYRVSFEDIIGDKPYREQVSRERIADAISYLRWFFRRIANNELGSTHSPVGEQDLNAIREQWLSLNAGSNTHETDKLKELKQASEKMLGRLRVLSGLVRRRADVNHENQNAGAVVAT